MVNAPKPQTVGCYELQGPNDLDISWTGPDLEQGRLPAFFYFALTADESLCLDPFNQPVAFLQGSPIRAFSMTLPAHGQGFDKLKAIEAWAKAYEGGEDPIGVFLDLAEENIRYLIDMGFLESHAIAFGGLSRGGLVASLLSLRFDNVKTVLGFAPVTDPLVLSRFEKFSDDSLPGKMALKHQANFLTQKNIRFYIANHDERVSTEACFECIRAIAISANEQRERNGAAEMIIGKSIGFQGHGTSPEVFYDGAEWVKQQLLKGSA